MKRFISRAVAVILTCVLAFGSAVCFAADSTESADAKKYYDYGTYVLLGDSVASGHNDLVYVEHKSGLKFTLQNADSTLEKTRTQTSAFAYFVSGSISTASITIRTHDNAYGIPSLGVKTLKTFHKYQVDVLGNVFPVHKETRQKFR